MKFPSSVAILYKSVALPIELTMHKISPHFFYSENRGKNTRTLLRAACFDRFTIRGLDSSSTLEKERSVWHLVLRWTPNFLLFQVTLDNAQTRRATEAGGNYKFVPLSKLGRGRELDCLKSNWSMGNIPYPVGG